MLPIFDPLFPQGNINSERKTNTMVKEIHQVCLNAAKPDSLSSLNRHTSCKY